MVVKTSHRAEEIISSVLNCYCEFQVLGAALFGQGFCIYGLKKKSFLSVSVPSPQTRMLSPSSTWVRGSAWARGLHQTWVSPHAARTTGPICGSGVRVTGSSTWPRPSAWRWTCAASPWPWSTVAPTFCYGGVAWKELFTPFTRWAWWSAMAKL